MESTWVLMAIIFLLAMLTILVVEMIHIYRIIKDSIKDEKPSRNLWFELDD